MYNKTGDGPKFELAPVIPFQCDLCNEKSADCDCSKIETLSEERQFGIIPEISKIELPENALRPPAAPSADLSSKIHAILPPTSEQAADPRITATGHQNNIRYLRPKTIGPCALLSGAYQVSLLVERFI